MSVRWILEAYRSLHQSGTNFMIVPVMISYDRIIEGKNLATEMVNGMATDFTMYTAHKQLLNSGNSSLGQVYVKYLDPINLE